MVVYNTYLDKENRTHKILCVDMKDANGMMTITLIFPAHLIEKHEQKIIPRDGISITNFKIIPKRGYDRGDFDCVISILESSVIETVSPMWKEYNFIPNTTIKQFASNTHMSPIGIIGVVVTLDRKFGSQYNLHIKYGNTEDDKVMVCFSIVNFFFNVIIC